MPVGENGRRKVQGLDGLCDVTKSNACKIVRCEVCKGEGRGMSDQFLVDARQIEVGGFRM